MYDKIVNPPVTYSRAFFLVWLFKKNAQDSRIWAMIYGMNGSVQGENQTHVMIPCEYWAPWCETAHVNLTDDEFDSVYLLNPSPFKTAAPYLNIFLAYDLVVHFCSHFCLHLHK